MKTNFLKMIMMIILITGCTSESNFQSVLTKSNWKVSWYGSISEPTNLADNSKITVAFTSAPYKNNVGLESKCASIYAVYTLGDQNKIKFEEVNYSTKESACVDPKGQMLKISALLMQVDSIQSIESGDLILNADKNGIRLEQEWE